MNYIKASKIYKEVNHSTLPLLEYVLLLLNEVLKNIQTFEESDDHEVRKDALRTAQKALFELMATVDRRTPEGNRLFSFYVFINQCIIDVQVNQEAVSLRKVQDYLSEMIDAWEDAKQQSRVRTYTTEWI